MVRLDPWGSSQFQDYARLRDEFGIEPMTPELWMDLEDPHWLLRRGTIFGHRDFGVVHDAIVRKEPWAVLTGLMPSGKMHLGHKMVIDQCIDWQGHGADVTIAVADFEAYATRNLSIDQARALGIDEYVKTYLALGLKPQSAEIYFQSTRSRVKDLAYEFGLKVNLSTLRALYGFEDNTSLAHVNAPLMQAGDILHVQREDKGGPRPTLVPVGVDQDPHIRLARDIATAFRIYGVQVAADGRPGIFLKGAGEAKALLDRAERTLRDLGFGEVKRNDAYKAIYVDGATKADLQRVNLALAKAEPQLGGYGFVQPSSSYHRFMSGLDGGKMSSSRPSSAIFLSDDLKESEKKFMQAKTGGRASAEEQRRLGANPDICSVYEVYHGHLARQDDKYLNVVYTECKTGKRLCGECKGEAWNLLKAQVKEIQEKKAQVTQADLKEILSYS